MKPFGDHLPDGGLFVVNRHDDGEFGRVHGLRLWSRQKHFLTGVQDSAYALRGSGVTCPPTGRRGDWWRVTGGE